MSDRTRWYWTVAVQCPSWEYEIAVHHWCKDNLGREASDFVQFSDDDGTMYHFNNFYRASQSMVWVDIKDKQKAMICKLTWGGAIG